ncbi:MAG: alpha/beta fold hydrolase, partial [Anaerolineales bacterium]|nr:alpha/beta fold hydrolase [Anaerolineales bacterium]
MKQKRFLKWFLWLVLTAGLLAGCSQAAPALEPTVTLEDCRLEGGRQAECGIVTVPENRAEANGRQLDLAVTVLPAISNAAASDPLFLLAGGPGQGAIDTFGPFASIFREIRQTRDLVLVDQRGTGDSNPLICDSFDALPLDATEEEGFAAVAECRTVLEQKADLAHYLTATAAQDLEAVRLALGYEQISLFGVSYGTRLALEYARQYPDSVRAMILDAVTGPEMVIFQDVGRDGQAALDYMFLRCIHDAACAEQFPDLQTEYETILERLSTPQMTTFAHPFTGEKITLSVTRPLVSQIIFNLLYSPDTVSLLPLMIHQAYTENDYGTLVAQGMMSSANIEIADGLLYTIACTEDAPILDEAAVEQTDFAVITTDFLEVCELWPQQTPDPA